MTGKIRAKIHNDLGSVWLVGVLVRSVCAELGFLRKETHRMELAVVEAINNCIQHGYRDRQEGTVEIEMEITPELICLEIADEGEAILQSVLREAASGNSREFAAEERESGRGVEIIAEVMDSFVHLHEGGRNVLRMEKKRPRG